MYSFPYLEPVCGSISSSNGCFLISLEASKVVWYCHLFQNFPQFLVIHTVKGFGVVNRAEIDVSLELACFFDDPMDVGNLISGSSAFSKSSLNIWKFTVHVLLLLGPYHYQNLIYWLFRTATLEQSLRALWDAASWAAVLILPQIKLKSELSSRTSFFSQQLWQLMMWPRVDFLPSTGLQEESVLVPPAAPCIHPPSRGV